MQSSVISLTCHRLQVLKGVSLWILLWAVSSGKPTGLVCKCFVFLMSASCSLGFFFGHKSEVRRLNQIGTQEATYNLRPLSRIHDMVVTSDNNTIIAVGETFNRSDWKTVPESAIAGEQSFPERSFETLNASI